MIGVLLLYTAFVTPFEVCMLARDNNDFRHPLFVLNRISDTVFISDLCINFNLAYVPLQQ